MATLLRCHVLFETYHLPLGAKSLPLVASKVLSAPDKSSAWLDKLSHEALLYVIRSGSAQPGGSACGYGFSLAGPARPAAYYGNHARCPYGCQLL